MRGYDIERNTAALLQQSFLPDVIPKVTDLDIAVRYSTNATHADVGGDFYDVLLDDEHVAFALGDVVGHSLEAAAVMAQLRTAIRAYMLEGHGPAATIQRLNGMLRRFHPGASATACCAVYSWRTGQCELSNAGHIPPLVVSNGTAAFLPYGGTLLGAEHFPAPVTRFTLKDSDAVVFYTDGLIERRGE